MGYSQHISATSFPRQGQWAHRSVLVRFHNDERVMRGVVVRDDNSDPYVMIIRLEDGRHVLSAECVYARDTATVPGNTVCTCPVLDGHEVTGSSCPLHGLPPAPCENTRGVNMDSVERRLADAKLGAAIDNAIDGLPENYAVRVLLTRGRYTVQLLYDGRPGPCFDGVLAQAIADAVKWVQ